MSGEKLLLKTNPNKQWKKIVKCIIVVHFRALPQKCSYSLGDTTLGILALMVIIKFFFLLWFKESSRNKDAVLQQLEKHDLEACCSLLGHH